jgi:hypothetical protein
VKVIGGDSSLRGGMRTSTWIVPAQDSLIIQSVSKMGTTCASNEDPEQFVYTVYPNAAEV